MLILPTQGKDFLRRCCTYFGIGGALILELTRTYVRIPDYVELDNAEELADAIIREVELKEAWLTRVLGNSADPDASVGKWDRRLAQCGGIDEMSSGVQATYFSPNGQLVGLVAYIDAEWMDE